MNRRRGLEITISRRTVNKASAGTRTRRIEEQPPGELKLQQTARHIDFGRNCTRCNRIKSAAREFSRKITPDCNHNPMLCRACIAAAIRGRLAWPEIRCPEPDCRAHFRPEDVREYVSDGDYQT
jgi:hypothetical protein